jgi:hypothetical protein
MGVQIGTMRQDASGLTTPIHQGFSWPAFFFGAFWYAAKGMWGMAILSILISMVTFGVAWLFLFPFLANKQYREHLASRGYRLASAAVV